MKRLNATATILIERAIALSFFFHRRANDLSLARISIISYSADFVNRQIAQKIKPSISHNCATLPVDFWCGLWYTNDVKGKQGGIESALRFLKNRKNPLTNHPSCDTIRVQNRGSAFGEGEPPTARHPRGSIPLPLPLLQCLRLGRSVGAVMRVQVQPLEKSEKTP